MTDPEKEENILDELMDMVDNNIISIDDMVRKAITEYNIDYGEIKEYLSDIKTDSYKPKRIEEFKIWSEGYVITGQSSDTIFRKVCVALFKNNDCYVMRNNSYLGILIV